LDKYLKGIIMPTLAYTRGFQVNPIDTRVYQTNTNAILASADAVIQAADGGALLSVDVENWNSAVFVTVFYTTSA